MNRKYMM